MMNDLERIWKETSVFYIKLMPKHLLRKPLKKSQNTIYVWDLNLGFPLYKIVHSTATLNIYNLWHDVSVIGYNHVLSWLVVIIQTNICSDWVNN